MGKLQRDKIDRALEGVEVEAVMCNFCNNIYHPIPPSSRVCPRCNLTEVGESTEDMEEF